MWTRKFWALTGERALKSFAQSLILLMISDEGLKAAVGVNVLTVDWLTVTSFGAGAALLSVLTSILSAKAGPDQDSPSLV